MIASAEAIAGWAEEAQALLPERAYRIDPRRREQQTAPALLRALPARQRGRG